MIVFEKSGFVLACLLFGFLSIGVQGRIIISLKIWTGMELFFDPTR